MRSDSCVKTLWCRMVLFLLPPGDFLPADVLSLDAPPGLVLVADVLRVVGLLADVLRVVGLPADVFPVAVFLVDVHPVVVFLVVLPAVVLLADVLSTDWTPSVGVSGLKHSGTRGRAGCVVGRRGAVVTELDPEPAGLKAIFKGPGDPGEGGANLQALWTAWTLNGVVLSEKSCREATVRPRVRQATLGSRGQRSPNGRPAVARAGVASASAVFLWVDGVGGRPRDRT